LNWVLACSILCLNYEEKHGSRGVWNNEQFEPIVALLFNKSSLLGRTISYGSYVYIFWDTFLFYFLLAYAIVSSWSTLNKIYIFLALFFYLLQYPSLTFSVKKYSIFIYYFNL
jgi:hypothetical protein